MESFLFLKFTLFIFKASNNRTLAMLQARRFFPQLYQPTTNKPIGGILYSVTVVLISSISWDSLRISISLLTLPICSCMSSVFPIKVLSIFITDVSNSWSGYSNIPAISESGFDARSVSSNWVFCLLVHLVILLKARQDALSERNSNRWGFGGVLVKNLGKCS